MPFWAKIMQDETSAGMPSHYDSNPEHFSSWNSQHRHWLHTNTIELRLENIKTQYSWTRKAELPQPARTKHQCRKSKPKFHRTEHPKLIKMSQNIQIQQKQAQNNQNSWKFNPVSHTENSLGDLQKPVGRFPVEELPEKRHVRRRPTSSVRWMWKTLERENDVKDLRFGGS